MVIQAPRLKSEILLFIAVGSPHTSTGGKSVVGNLLLVVRNSLVQKALGFCKVCKVKVSTATI